MSIVNLHKDNLDKLLKKLHSEDENEREATIKKISKLKLNAQDGLRILDYTKNKFPPSEYEWIDISARLIDICAKKPYVAYINKIESIFDSISLPAKISALLFLAEYENSSALIVYLSLLGRIYMDLNGVPYGSLLRRPRYPEILFPTLLKYIDNKYISRDIYHLLLTYFNSGLVDEECISSYKNEIVKDIVFMAERILDYDIDDSSSIWDDEEYMELRNFADIHFDLAGYIKDIRIIEALISLLEVKDMRIKMFVVLSLLKHGCNVDQKNFLDIASNSEMRNWFYEGLVNLGMEELFPNEYKNQKSFAESNLVDWLCYPTELGRVPDEIELMQVNEEANSVHYLFRFRSNSEEWKDKGWMAGLSGPFERDTLYLSETNGFTFSKFDEWDSKTPKEHIESILTTLRTFYGISIN